MKLARRLAALTAVVFSTLGATGSAMASTFEQAEVDRSKFIPIAAPIGQTNGYQLLIVEQISETQSCWNEYGSNPTVVDPLLLNFDFSGTCGRATDSNGYSVRLANQDFGLQYNLRVIQRGSELVLVGIPFGRRDLPQIEIGRTGGLTAGFARIYLDSGWRLTRRVYQGRSLGHLYLTNDLTLAELTTTPVVQPLPVPDSVAMPDVSPEVSEIDRVESTEGISIDADATPTIEFGEDPTPNEPEFSIEIEAPNLPELTPTPPQNVPALTPQEASRETLSPLPEFSEPR
ncbi:MAG: DUF3747 domain-containing protein [Cyanobacteria bacterium SID2]|nr:DUF3747 domain-containing protein [Cyanobacteria bacterium SID2]MBP0005791.1 DUF3747 domain-containing protein [Cyanobacteria bacterium SBC]